MYINTHAINGNVGRDAVLRETAKGKVLSFSVANTSPFTKKTTWYNVSLWGNRAEALEPYIKKGTKVVCIGETSLEKYTDKNGNERVDLVHRANDVQLEARTNGETSGASENDDEEAVVTEDLPF